MALNRFIEHAQKSTLAGLLFRLATLTIIQSLVLVLLLLGSSRVRGIGESDNILIVFMMLLGFQLFGQIISERPQGIEYAYLRLGGSIAARTFFPLLMLVGIDFLVEPGFIESTMVSVLTLYFVGMIFGIGLHVANLNKQNKAASDSKN